MVLASQLLLAGKRRETQCYEPAILAFSALSSRETTFLNIKSATESGRILLSDRRGWVDHLTGAAIVKSTIRVVAVQSSNMVANYLQDQLQADFQREELIKDGKLTPKKADEQQEEWEQREWDMRLKALPSKVFVGLAKFHAITMVMRCFEFVAEKMVDEYTLDRLTMDPFDTALRVSKRTHNNAEIRSDMYRTCLWANVIAFMADYSVHQVILSYTYYQYYQSKRKRRKASAANHPNDDDNNNSDLGPLMLSYLTKSTSLAMSRALGLFAAAFGGAWGSSLYPGWGTLMGSQFCDGVVASVFDELQPAVMKVQQL
eukprot:CAMPEP_0119009576 /NCGR_PEP_ID=MMETSP1176-20130426/4465_1 /TAXON_ID=265551 /ORGANISM="Synedropsis recta cf, Strain CCMP1620" /LENGTH=315 /DNA_ID=CAMNT_0006962119 /DNA_START=122 /DNA_END=1069 /DNA_ORIENTATION=-